VLIWGHPGLSMCQRAWRGHAKGPLPLRPIQDCRLLPILIISQYAATWLPLRMTCKLKNATSYIVLRLHLLQITRVYQGVGRKCPYWGNQSVRVVGMRRRGGPKPHARKRQASWRPWCDTEPCPRSCVRWLTTRPLPLCYHV